MPVKKAIKKSKQEDKCFDHDMAKEKLRAVTDDVAAKAKELKSKYDKADPETKKKIIAGAAGVAAGLSALIRWKQHKKKKE